MPENNIKITVVADSIDTLRGYKLESIKPGDIIQVNHPKITPETSKWDEMIWDEDVWDFNLLYSLGQPMQVQEIKYNFDTLDIDLTSVIKDVAHRIEDINRNKDVTDSENIPDSPT